MKLKLFILALLFFQSSFSVSQRIDIVECFTHPISAISNPISLYTEPYHYEKELYIDHGSEGGYLVIAEEIFDNFIKIRLLNDSTYVRWVHVGDVGVVIQNYDHLLIPIYSDCSDQSTIITYIDNSYIGLIVNFSKDFICLMINTQKNLIYGWVEKKYICGDPYTTCN